MAAKLILVSLLLAGTVLAVQSQLEPTRRIRFRPKLRRTSPAPTTQEDNAISNDLNLSRDEAQQLISKLKQSPSRRTDLPPRRAGFSSNKRTRFRRPQKQPLGRSRVTEATTTVETTTISKRDQFVPRLRNKNPSIPARPFKGQVIGGEVTLDSGIRSQNEQIEVVKFKPTEATLSNPGFEVGAENVIEGSDFISFTKESLFDTLSQEREEFRERAEERDRIDIALATEEPLENSIEIQTTERQRSLQQLFKRPSDREGGRKATKRRRGRPVARPATSPVPRPIAPATEATFIPSSLTEARNTPTTEDPLQALLRRASSLTSSSKAVTEAAKEVVEQSEQPRRLPVPAQPQENEITDKRIGVRRRIPGRSGGRKNAQSGRRRVTQSSRDFIRQDRLRLRSRARVNRPAAKTEDSLSNEDNGVSRTRPSFRRPIDNTIVLKGNSAIIDDQEEGSGLPERPNFSSFPTKSSSSSQRRPAFQPRIRLSQASRNNQQTVFSPSQDNLSIQTSSIGSIGTIPITEPFSQTVPATEAFRDEIAIATSRPKPTTPFTPLRAEPTARPAPRAQPTARPLPRVQPTAQPQPSVAEQRPRTTITRPHSAQIQSLNADGNLDFQIPLEFDPFSFTTPGTPAVADFTRRPFVSAQATTPAPPQPTRRVNQRPRGFAEAPRSIQQSAQAVPQPQRAPVQAQRERQFANFGAQAETSRRAQAPRRLPVPAQPQAPRRIPIPAQPQAPRRLPAPVPAQAPRRLPVPAQPQTPQRLPVPAQPQAPRRLPVPAPPRAPQSVPVQPRAPIPAPVPAPSGVSGITQLRNNDFASFDRQFGGSVPFTAFRSIGASQTTAPQTVNGNRFANQNIALLQNQNTLVQPQNSFQPIPAPQSIPLPQRIQPGIQQQPQRVVPQNFQFPFQARDQTFNIGGQPQAFQRFAPQPFRINAGAASQNIQSFAPRPQFQSSSGFQPQAQQQFQFQTAASQNVPVAVRQPLNLAPNTFFGHPASNINLNTGSFSISTK